VENNDAKGKDIKLTFYWKNKTDIVNFPTYFSTARRASGWAGLLAVNILPFDSAACEEIIHEGVNFR
jgi:hypothetical protein